MQPLAMLSLETCRVDLVHGKVFRDGAVVPLTAMEVALLRFLAERGGVPTTQDELLREVWGYHGSVVSRTVRSTVSRLRKKLEHNPADPRVLVTVYGHGYVLHLAPATPAPVRSTVPAEVDRFFGRDAELAVIRDALASGRRLVTLLGPPGIGKTRLAQHLARTEPGAARHAWFCELADAQTAPELVERVAEGLGLVLSGRGDPIAAIGARLRDRGASLVVLDNLEQVVEHVGETVAPWLQAAPELVFVATSRSALRLRAEFLIPLAGLPEAEAAALYRDRGRALGVRDLADDHVRAVVEQLDGVPLALELAASQLPALGPEALYAHVERRRADLHTRWRDVPPRHASLRAALDTSWDLLDAFARRAFARLAVFRGGWTAEAAEAVLGGDVAEVETLVVASMVRVRPDGRHAMLEYIRDYARDQAERLGELAGARDRHLRYCARMGDEPALRALNIHGGVERTAALRAEAANLRAATAHGVTLDDATVVADAAMALAHALLNVTPGAEIVRVMDSVLSAMAFSESQRVRLLVTRAHGARLAWSTDDAMGALETALASARRAGDRAWEGRALHAIGLLQSERGDVTAATETLRAALQAHREAGEHFMEARTRGPLGMMRLYADDLGGAIDELNAALALARELGDTFAEGSALGNLCGVLRQASRLDEACAAGEAALAIAQRMGDVRKQAMVLINLGTAYEVRGALDEASRCLTRAQELHRELGHRYYEGFAMFCLANLAGAEGAHGAARERLTVAIDRFREAGARRLEGIALGNLGTALLALGELAEARDASMQALEIHREQGHIRGEGAVLGTLVDIDIREGRLAHAWAQQERSEACLDGTGDNVEIATAALRRAELLMLDGAVEEAATAGTEAETLLTDAGLLPTSTVSQRVERHRARMRALHPGG